MVEKKLLNSFYKEQDYVRTPENVDWASKITKNFFDKMLLDANSYRGRGLEAIPPVYNYYDEPVAPVYVEQDPVVAQKQSLGPMQVLMYKLFNNNGTRGW